MKREFTSQLFRAACAMVSILVVCACGGAQSVSPATSQPGAAIRGASEPSTQRKVGGVYKVTRFTISSGEVATLSKDLIVFASESIQINGILKIPEGRHFEFYAPSVQIFGTGQISWDYVAAPAAKAIDSIDSCFLTVSGNGIALPPGADLYVAANEREACDMYVDSGITLTPGSASSPTPSRSVDGQAGGTIQIGTLTALRFISFAAADLHEKWSAFAPRQINLKAPIKAGDGGLGSAGVVANTGTRCSLYSGGTGGAGGSVLIAATQVNQLVPGSSIAAGNGANGGATGSTGQCGAINGTIASPNGESVFAAESYGGNGGDISIKSKKPPVRSDVQSAGNGGNPGAIACIGGGHGAGSTVSTAAGNGGDGDLSIGRIGTHGMGGNDRNVTDGKYPAFCALGGSGGPGGGNGGSFTLEWPSTMKPPLKGVTITIGYGWGVGAGISCGSHGTNGGNGGTLHDRGAYSSFTIENNPFYSNGSFGGGNGGDGTPPGTGGTGGYNDEGVQIAPNGASGLAC